MHVREIKRENFLWLDIREPTAQDLETIGKQYHLDPTTLVDCMEPEHLPKCEVFDDFTFIILRDYDLSSEKKADTVQKITQKVALFLSSQILITIHRADQSYINEIYEKVLAKSNDKPLSTFTVANHIIFEVAKTYETGLDGLFKIFEAFEQDVFGRSKKVSLISSYLLKRRIDIMTRMITLMKEPVKVLMMSSPAQCRLELKNTKEHLDKVNYLADLLHDNLGSLLSLQVALASQATNEASFKTSEVMRVLTVISIFFMPLNFIVGFYGMNFSELPLLNWQYGGHATVVALVIVSIATFFWLRLKNIIK